MRLREVIRADFKANPRDPKAQSLLFAFRFTQYLRAKDHGFKFLGIFATALYRLFSEWLLGIELRPGTKVGPGLSIHHGVGLVINDKSVIGSNVRLRHATTIGHKRSGGGCPIIGDGVDIGAGVIILGDVRVGVDAIIAAGSVVLMDVPDGALVAGNPAVVKMPK